MTSLRPLPFELDDHGTISLLYPLTEQAAQWLRNVTSEEAQFWGDALVIEHRYVESFLEASLQDGDLELLPVED